MFSTYLNPNVYCTATETKGRSQSFIFLITIMANWSNTVRNGQGTLKKENIVFFFFFGLVGGRKEILQPLHLASGNEDEAWTQYYGKTANISKIPSQ